jgi:hypothetical protein
MVEVEVYALLDGFGDAWDMIYAVIDNGALPGWVEKLFPMWTPIHHQLVTALKRRQGFINLIPTCLVPWTDQELAGQDDGDFDQGTRLWADNMLVVDLMSIQQAVLELESKDCWCDPYGDDYGGRMLEYLYAVDHRNWEPIIDSIRGSLEDHRRLRRPISYVIARVHMGDRPRETEALPGWCHYQTRATGDGPITASLYKAPDIPPPPSELWIPWPVDRSYDFYVRDLEGPNGFLVSGVVIEIGEYAGQNRHVTGGGETHCTGFNDNALGIPVWIGVGEDVHSNFSYPTAWYEYRTEEIGHVQCDMWGDYCWWVHIGCMAHLRTADDFNMYVEAY